MKEPRQVKIGSEEKTSMRMMRRQGRRLGIAAALYVLAATVHAQGTSGIDLTQMLQGLSPDQQAQILQRLGATGPGATGSAAGANGQRTGPYNPNDQSNPLNQRPRRATTDQELQLGPPEFKPLDTVIVEVDLQPLKPWPIDTTNMDPTLLQAAQTSQGQSTQAGQGQSSQGVNQNGAPILSQDEKDRLTKLTDLIRMKDPYQLDQDGVLNLPGFAGIPMAGLTEMQGALRLEVEPALKGLYFRLMRLPLKTSGLAALKPFGYDLFNESPSTFAPVTNVPVPADYVMGAGDVLRVQLYGNQNTFLTLPVGRDGTVSFPELGPINVAGQHFNTVKEEIEARIARQMIGVKGDVSMSDTRAIQVFVLGEAQTPGSYTVSGLGTITSALYAAGGIKDIGSLRDVQLKRAGTVVRRLDLYDLLLKGDNSNDVKLLPGDVVFIPPLGQTASVEGEVQRPAIYEIKSGTSVADLVQLAGGLTPKADAAALMLSGLNDRGGQSVVAVNLAADLRGPLLRNGDVLRVAAVRSTLDSGVLLQGYVYAPGEVAWRQGLRLTDVLHSVDDLRPDADLHYVLIRREERPNRHVRVLSVDLAAALARPGSAADVPLAARDQITVFDLQSGRDRVMQPLIDDLKLQSSANEPTQLVHVDGSVRVPGDYPLESGMRVADLVRAGGSLSDSAYSDRAELARYDIINGQQRKTQVIEIDLAAALRGDPRANLVLQPFDNLSVKQISLWGEQETVVLEGQVRFPGTYSIQHGETLKSVIARAGGLTEFAFPEGSVFTRTELQQREQNQLDFLGERLQTDISTMALQAAAGSALNGGGGGGTNATAALQIGQNLLAQLHNSRAVGRLVIDLPQLMKDRAGSEQDVVLRNGDHLLVPRYQQEVTVIGEVQSVTSHLYRADLSREDYINQSGGVTNHADSKKIYVVRANGSVVANNSGRFFRVGSNAVTIHPGDTIVVPLDTEHLPPLPMWQAITQILYNTAVAVAAVHSL